MDLQKEQDSSAHGSGWMLVICKHWNWNWHWDWKYYIFLTKGSDTVWVTASTKLRDLLITWSRDRCKALYLPFRNTYGHRNWQSSNLQWGNLTLKVTIPFDCVANEKYLYLHFRNTYGHQTWQGGNLPSEDPTSLVMWSCDKCKTLYLHFCNIYDHQTWQSCNLQWRNPNFKIMQTFDYVITWQMKKIYIWPSTISMATKVCRVVTYGWKNPRTKLHDLLIIWSRYKYKTLYLHFSSTYNHETGQSSNLQWADPTFKVTWTFDYVVTWQMKKTYLHLHNTYGHLTWQSGNLHWGYTTH